MRLAPYHPSSNGLAERAVQSFKQGMKKLTSGTIDETVACFLFHYWNPPHSTTGQMPSELHLGHRPRSRLDLLLPDLTSIVTKAQHRQKTGLAVGSTWILASNPLSNPSWLSNTA